MNFHPNKYYAVITGDVIKSRKAKPKLVRPLADLLKEIFADTQSKFADQVVLPFDIFRGDGWQGLISNPKKSFRIGMYIRAKCIANGFNTRFAISINTIEGFPKRVLEGQGEAFTRSGMLLDELSRPSRHKVNCGVITPFGDDPGLDIGVWLIDAISSKWTERQALAVSGALVDMKQEDIAKLWKGVFDREEISQQAVQKHLEAASFDSIESSISRIEEMLEFYNKNWKGW